MVAPPFVFQATRFCQLATALAVLYDHALTLGEEIELVWRKKWTVSHIFFLANRYLGGLFFLFYERKSVLASHDWFRVQAWMSTVIIWTVQALMLYRVAAMHEDAQLITRFMTVCYGMQIIAMSVILGMAKGARGISVPYPGVHICAATHVPQKNYVYWIPVLIFELILFSLAFWKGYSHAFKFKGGNWWCPRLLMGLLMRDTVIHFLVCYTLYLGNAFVWAFLPPMWMEISECFAVAVTCIMGSRLVLNLREAYYLPAEQEFVGDQTNYYDHRCIRTVGPTHAANPSTFQVARIGRRQHNSDFDDSEYDEPSQGRSIGGYELEGVSGDEPLSFGGRDYQFDGKATESYGSSTLANTSGGSGKSRGREESADSVAFEEMHTTAEKAEV